MHFALLIMHSYGHATSIVCMQQSLGVISCPLDAELFITVQLANKDSFKNLGMIFTKTHNMAAAAEHMLTPFVAGCRRIRQFALEHRLTETTQHALVG